MCIIYLWTTILFFKTKPALFMLIALIFYFTTKFLLVFFNEIDLLKAINFIDIEVYLDIFVNFNYSYFPGNILSLIFTWIYFISHYKKIEYCGVIRLKMLIMRHAFVFIIIYEGIHCLWTLLLDAVCSSPLPGRCGLAYLYLLFISWNYLKCIVQVNNHFTLIYYTYLSY